MKLFGYLFLALPLIIVFILGRSLSAVGDLLQSASMDVDNWWHQKILVKEKK